MTYILSTKFLVPTFLLALYSLAWFLYGHYEGFKFARRHSKVHQKAYDQPEGLEIQLGPEQYQVRGSRSIKGGEDIPPEVPGTYFEQHRGKPS